MTCPQMLQPALYRAFQFFAALKATLPAWAGGGLTPAHRLLINHILSTPAQRQLFARMSANDQRHALAVVSTLQQAGYYQPALLQAGLLHDVAKSMGQPVLHRVLIVLLKAFWPGALARLSAAPVPGETSTSDSAGRAAANTPSSFPAWRRPFIIHAHHPAIGATWAEAVRCEPLAVRLIARHQENFAVPPCGEEEELLAALQWADNLN